MKKKSNITFLIITLLLVMGCDGEKKNALKTSVRKQYEEIVEKHTNLNTLLEHTKMHADSLLDSLKGGRSILSLETLTLEDGMKENMDEIKKKLLKHYETVGAFASLRHKIETDNISLKKAEKELANTLKRQNQIEKQFFNLIEYHKNLEKKYFENTLHE